MHKSARIIADTSTCVEVASSLAATVFDGKPIRKETTTPDGQARMVEIHLLRGLTFSSEASTWSSACNITPTAIAC